MKINPNDPATRDNLSIRADISVRFMAAMVGTLHPHQCNFTSLVHQKAQQSILFADILIEELNKDQE